MQYNALCLQLENLETVSNYNANYIDKLTNSEALYEHAQLQYVLSVFILFLSCFIFGCQSTVLRQQSPSSIRTLFLNLSEYTFMQILLVVVFKMLSDFRFSFCCLAKR